ncbi:MAG: flagellar motor switch protein FliN [Syntrophobacterales bacterium]
MATLNNSQAVEDFDWDKPLEKETESQGDDALELDPTSESLDPVSESINSAPPEKKEKAANMELLLDIPLEITAELGRTRMIINDLLQLGQGSVIELNKLAGEPLEILVNQKLIARGEVVVVNEKFGIRLTDIISPLERPGSLEAVGSQIPASSGPHPGLGHSSSGPQTGPDPGGRRAGNLFIGQFRQQLERHSPGRRKNPGEAGVPSARSVMRGFERSPAWIAGNLS